MCMYRKYVGVNVKGNLGCQVKLAIMHKSQLLFLQDIYLVDCFNSFHWFFFQTINMENEYNDTEYREHIKTNLTCLRKDDALGNCMKVMFLEIGVYLNSPPPLTLVSTRHFRNISLQEGWVGWVFST